MRRFTSEAKFFLLLFPVAQLAPELSLLSATRRAAGMWVVWDALAPCQKTVCALRGPLVVTIKLRFLEGPIKSCLVKTT